MKLHETIGIVTRKMNAEVNREGEPGRQLPTGGSSRVRVRRTVESIPGEPFWLCEWRDVVFLHFEVAPYGLQPDVPFALDLFDGRAFVSLVAFTLSDLRPRVGGRLSRFLFKPFGTHRFLNVRTYVQYRGGKGIHFLAEWLDAPWINRMCGPLLYGLPFRSGQIEYQNAGVDRRVHGRVSDGTGKLEYSGNIVESPRGAEAGSLAEFLLERYLAFTCRPGHAVWFPVWHEPWQYAPVRIQTGDFSLLNTTGQWVNAARLHTAHWSPGASEVLMGWRKTRDLYS